MKLSPFVVAAFAAGAMGAPAPITKAVAVLGPTQGNSATGKVTFTATAGGIKVEAQVKGLTPGAHGFHIHEFGDCSAPDGTSAGGHFNPAGQPHAGPTADHRHAGDLGNIEANNEGVATLESVDSHIAFEGPDSILGRGVIIHAKADDFKTQPTGDAGARVACGVIGVAKGE